MKTNKYIQFWSILLVFLTVFGIGNAWGDAAVASKAPTDGKYYIIALYHDSKYYALPHIGSGANLYCGKECTLNGSGEVTAIDGESSPYDCLWLLTRAASSGQFYISYINSGTEVFLYKNGTTGASNYSISATDSYKSNSIWAFTSGTANSVTAYSVKTTKSTATANTVLRGDNISLQGGGSCYGFNVDGTSDSYEITLLPVPSLTVTFEAEGGTCATSSLTEASSNAGIELPEASPSDECASAGWEFAGWSTSSVTEQSSAPRLFSAGDQYYPLDYGTTLYAVYRKVSDETTTATFDATDLSDLTQVSAKTWNPAWYLHTASNIDLFINAYGLYSSTFDLDNTWGGGGKAWAYVDAHSKIASITLTLKSGTDLLDNVVTDAGSATLSGSDTEQSIDCSGNVTRVRLNPATSKETQITAIEVTYYEATFNSNPSCCDKLVGLSYNSAGSSNVSAMTFSETSLPTCSGTAGDREVTITVTPSTGYLFKSGDVLTWTKSSGTIPSAPTKVSGPTLNAGKYVFVYRFAQNDNGAGTFAATTSTYTNYRTTCSATYDIELDKNGGDADGSATVALNGTQLKNISAPTKTGYKVAGYYAESGKTNLVAAADGTLEADVEISSDDWTNGSGEWVKGSGATLYAKWEAISYSVRFNKNNGSATGTMSNESYDYDESKALTSNAFSLTGYTFAGWATSASGSVAHTDGKSVSNLSTTDGDVVDLYAVWQANTYDVTLAATDETSSVGSQVVTATYGSAMPTTLKGSGDVDAPERTGYTFDGWEYSSTQYYSYNSGTSTISSAHIWDIANSTTTLTPRWNVNSYTLTWNLDGGTVTEAGTGAAVDATGTPNSEVEYNAAITVPTVTKAGYTFAGWSSTPADNMPASNTTYTATWTALHDKYYDRMHGNGGSTDASGYKYTDKSGAGYSVPSCTDKDGETGNIQCEKDHYKFLGWLESTYINDDGSLKDGATSHLIPASGTTDATGKTYYAIWGEE